MTDFDLSEHDWRRWLGGGGSVVYFSWRRRAVKNYCNKVYLFISMLFGKAIKH